MEYTVFEGNKRLASGPLERVALKMKRRLKAKPTAALLMFSDQTGKQMDLDLSGSEAQILERLKVFVSAEQGTPSSAGVVGPGRPKLGVVAREVSLLPRHWEWLAAQTGGASATLRRLVEEAKKNVSERETAKAVQERTYKFMSALAGDLPQYEEVLRALFAKDQKKFHALMGDWPQDLKKHAKTLAAPLWKKGSK
jgi:hypothetical protein